MRKGFMKAKVPRVHRSQNKALKILRIKITYRPETDSQFY